MTAALYLFEKLVALEFDDQNLNEVAKRMEENRGRQQRNPQDRRLSGVGDGSELLQEGKAEARSRHSPFCMNNREKPEDSHVKKERNRSRACPVI